MYSRFSTEIPILLCLFFLSICFQADAIDTLTVRQVYSFNVGDTFDVAVNYDMIDQDQGEYLTDYQRLIVRQKSFSAGNDTLYIRWDTPLWGRYVWDTITHLDSFIIFEKQYVDTNCQMQYRFDTTMYPGHVSNSIDIRCFESGSSYSFTNGMGRTRYGYSNIGGNGIGYDSRSEEVVYYSNGTTSVGSPYYILNGSGHTGYVPLPESCAVWTWTVNLYGLPGNNWNSKIIEQVKTGAVLRYSGRNYVELIRRWASNDLNGNWTLHPDSSIGYFYNDSNYKSAYFVKDTGASPLQIYTTGLLNGERAGTLAQIQIDSVLIGGSYRTRWSYNLSYNTNMPLSCLTSQIAGIGSLHGLLPIDNYGSIATACGALTCFSICGQTLYPNDTTASCPLLTDIQDIQSFNDQWMRISPNPFHDNLSITVNNEATKEIAISIYDMLGRCVFTQNEKTIIPGFHTLELSGLPAGIYTLQIKSDSGNLMRRIIKE